MTAISKAIGATVIFVATLFATAFVSGLVLTQLWQWFVVEWFGLRPLNIPEALGLSLIITYTTKDFSQERETKENTDFWQALFATMLRLVLLFVVAYAAGWFYHNAR